ncbi:MAG: hypothetical protein Q9201_002081 [Fulgogasparrea decipioides]
MATVRKYAALPDLVRIGLREPSTEAEASSTLQTESNLSSPTEQEDGHSAIDRHRIDPNEARTSFLAHDTGGNPSYSWIGSKRGAYRTSNKRVQSGLGPDSDESTEDGDEDEESLERKLVRLRREVAEVKEAFQKRSKEPDLQEKLVEKDGPEPVEALDSLGLVLENIERPQRTGQGDAPHRLVHRLNGVDQSSTSQVPHVPADTTQKSGTTEDPMIEGLSYDLNHTISKVSDFDKRLRLLETVLGMDEIPLPTQGRVATQAVLPVLDGLDRRVSSISITDSSLDTISRQIRQMIDDTEKLAGARKATMAHNKSLGERDRTSTTKTGSRATEDVDQLDQSSKINALYGTLPTIESLSPLLPSVLDRLRSLRTIHADAALASESLSKVESQQATMADELRAWRDGLEKVESMIQNGEMSLKHNTEVIDKWVKDLESRMQETNLVEYT